MYNEFSHSPNRAKNLQNPDFYDFKNRRQRMDPMNLIQEPIEDKGAIWLGNLEAASDLESLKRYKIGAILSLCPQEIPAPVKKYLQLHQFYYAEDIESYDISKYFDPAFDFIEKARSKTNILIHCYAGISRSTTVLIAYLMRKKNMTVRECLDMIRSKRWQIYPNGGFLRQLAEFERRIQPGSGRVERKKRLNSDYIVNRPAQEDVIKQRTPRQDGPQRVSNSFDQRPKSINSAKPLIDNQSYDRSVYQNRSVYKDRNDYPKEYISYSYEQEQRYPRSYEDLRAKYLHVQNDRYDITKKLRDDMMNSPAQYRVLQPETKENLAYKDQIFLRQPQSAYGHRTRQVDPREYKVPDRTVRHVDPHSATYNHFYKQGVYNCIDCFVSKQINETPKYFHQVITSNNTITIGHSIIIDTQQILLQNEIWNTKDGLFKRSNIAEQSTILSRQSKSNPLQKSRECLDSFQQRLPTETN